MTRIVEYGLQWEIDPDPIKGQAGLVAENHYRQLFAPGQREQSFRRSDVWLDLGANLGAFALRAAKAGSDVIAVEPEHTLVRQLQQNIILNSLDLHVYVLECAAIAGVEDEVTLALSNSFTSTHRVGIIRGRKHVYVPAKNIATLLADTNATKVKMDIEGGEAELLEVMPLHNIEEIVFEYHFSMLKDTNWERFYAILARLEGEGLKIRKQPKAKSKAWHTIVWATR